MANPSETVLYPYDLDGYSTLPLVRNAIDEIRAEQINRLRHAIVAIEWELGREPSGSFATVADRLDSVGDANALIEAHLIDTLDAHDASSISIVDAGDNYISVNVEDALAELAAILPVSLDVIGADNTSVPNSGIPDFVNKDGTLFVFNTGAGINDLKKTQPVNITGIHIIDVGESNGIGAGAILTQVTFSPLVLQWQAPGDSAGATVDVTSLSAGDIAILESGTVNKKIRIARTSANLTLINGLTDTFDIYKLSAVSGSYSIESTEIKDSDFITHTSISATGTSNNQFMIGGFLFPADKGTLVLQRKLRTGSQFVPVAVLDLSEEFDESLRGTGQPVYSPTLDQFDTILLYDRLPAKKDYESLNLDASGNQIYDNFNLSATFSPFQVAKYIIPASNSVLVGGGLDSPADISVSEINNNISSYRLVHFIAGVTDFNGNPDSSNIYSISDTFGSEDSGNNTVRMSDVFLDDSASPRPNVASNFVLRPVVDVEVLEKAISGIHYYNSSDDLFDVEIASDNNLFKKTYLRNGILKFSTNVFEFPTSDGYSTEIPVTLLRDDGYVLFSNSNVPDYTTPDSGYPGPSVGDGKDRGYYFINSTYNTSKRLYPDVDKFSMRSNISARFYDPFGAGDSKDAYGIIPGIGNIRIFVNSYDRFRSNLTEEFFTDESLRIGSLENFDFPLERDQFTDVYGVNSDGYTLIAWDSSLALDTTPDPSVSTMSGLQVGGKFGGLGTPDDSADFIFPGLLYPQDDFSSAFNRPLQPGSVNYSGLTGDRYYQRVFGLGHTISGGKLRIKSSGSSLVSFNDIAVSNATRFCKIEVKIPGTNYQSSTGWLDVGKFFETGKFEDGDGALAPPLTGVDGDFTVGFTFGDRNTAESGDLIAVRITFLGAQIATAKQKIISYLQLLEA